MLDTLSTLSIADFAHIRERSARRAEIVPPSVKIPENFAFVHNAVIALDKAGITVGNADDLYALHAVVCGARNAADRSVEPGAIPTAR